MTRNQSPKLAEWLLRHFGSSPNNDAVIGDLTERCRQGRSSLWFWQQTGNAIATGLWQVVTEHKWMALRAVIVGWI